jgi:hypothetical protein
MSRGVLAVFGSIGSSNFDMLRSTSNAYHMPYITWSKPFEKNEEINDENNATNMVQSFQIYMQPELSATLISLIKYSRWKHVFYIYNSEIGIFHNEAFKNYS